MIIVDMGYDTVRTSREVAEKMAFCCTDVQNKLTDDGWAIWQGTWRRFDGTVSWYIYEPYDVIVDAAGHNVQRWVYRYYVWEKSDERANV